MFDQNARNNIVRFHYVSSAELLCRKEDAFFNRLRAAEQALEDADATFYFLRTAALETPETYHALFRAQVEYIDALCVYEFFWLDQELE